MEITFSNISESTSCFPSSQGLRETVHPYTFVARTGFKELLESEGAGDKAKPLLPKLQHSLRQALVSDSIFIHKTAALVKFSQKYEFV